MPAIAAIDTSTPAGAFAAPITTMTASDTITFDPTKKQLLVFRNTTAGSLTVTIDGVDGTTVAIEGLGSVSVAAGLPIVIAAGLSFAVVLSTIRYYCQGVVELKGASTLTVQMFNI